MPRETSTGRAPRTGLPTGSSGRVTARHVRLPLPGSSAGAWTGSSGLAGIEIRCMEVRRRSSAIKRIENSLLMMFQ